MYPICPMYCLSISYYCALFHFISAKFGITEGSLWKTYNLTELNFCNNHYGTIFHSTKLQLEHSKVYQSVSECVKYENDVDYDMIL